MPSDTMRDYKSADEISEHDVSEKESEDGLSLADAYRKVMSTTLTDFDCFAKVSKKKRFNFDD